MLVRAISQKPLLGISTNLVCLCVLSSFQHLLIVSDLDLHLQGHLALKYLKFGYFGGLLAWSIMESFISSGFFEIKKIKIFLEFVAFRILTLILWVSTQLGVCLSET